MAGEATFLTTDDGVRLRYTDQGTFNAGAGALVFLHGWGANGRWFDRNVPALSQRLRVLTLDYRGMGDSEHAAYGHRVSRLSADVHCLLKELDVNKAVLCGTSLGFTVIMNYVEIFGYDRLTGLAFVDQSACMYYKPGWALGAPELSNMSQVAALEAQLHSDFPALADAIISSGFGAQPASDRDREFFKDQILKSDPRALAAIMYNHANLDFRDLLPHLELPVLNFVGGTARERRRVGGGRPCGRLTTCELNLRRQDKVSLHRRHPMYGSSAAVPGMAGALNPARAPSPPQTLATPSRAGET